MNRKANWRQRNKAKLAADNKRYQAEHPDRIRNNNLKRQGWTLAEFNQQLVEQSYRCAICGVDLLLLPQKQIHADHDHLTGKRRGVLCHFCNTGLGNFQDRPEVLYAAVNYLRDHE